MRWSCLQLRSCKKKSIPNSGRVTILYFIVTMKCLIKELIKFQEKFMNGVKKFMSIA
jgi:hypothetical protein